MLPMTRDEFLSSIHRLAGSVWALHQRFELSGTIDTTADDVLAYLRDRVPIMVEEFGEHAASVNRDKLPEASAEACDMAFVAIGTLLTIGLEGRSYVNEVADKNDRKTRQTHMISAGGKLVKKCEDQETEDVAK